KSRHQQAQRSGEHYCSCDPTEQAQVAWQAKTSYNPLVLRNDHQNDHQRDGNNTVNNGRQKQCLDWIKAKESECDSNPSCRDNDPIEPCSIFWLAFQTRAPSESLSYCITGRTR